MGVAAVKWATG